jgi:DNA-binding transcriptional ArsR family regulator
MVYHHAALDSTFAALADPTRRAIIARLVDGDRTISELASRFAMSLPAVSKHVRVLERAGLARVRRDGRARRTTLVAAPMRDATAWMERYRRFWEFQLDQLAAYLATADEPSRNGLTSAASTEEESQRPRPRNQTTSAARPSTSGASSPPHGSAPSTPAPKRKSSTTGARRRR